jgi:hypothetical protein
VFEKLNHEEHLNEYPFYKELGIDLEEYGKIDRKIEKDIYSTVDQDNKTPFPVELDDLTRLHFLVLSRKVTTILEFGVGKSTLVFNDALKLNKQKHEKYIKDNLRRSNLFECHSVDNNNEWLEEVKKEFGNLEHVNLHYSPLEVSTFNSRVCTFYSDMPNISPDLIYLDAPDQFSASGNVRGISTAHSDRMPMSADILAFEHFLTPGTLIVVDGRTANARFLKANFQRNWSHHHSVEHDQHFFELREQPLGKYNLSQIEYCLGKDWLEDL